VSLIGTLFRRTPKENPFTGLAVQSTALPAGDSEALRASSRSPSPRPSPPGEGEVAVRAEKRLVTSSPTKALEQLPVELQRIVRPEAAMNWLSPMLKSITPARIESILRGSLSGDFSQQWELFDLMEDTWPRLLTNLNKVKRAVSKMDWKIEPWAEEEQAPSAEADDRAKFVSRCVWKMRPDPASGDNAFEGTVFDILDAWAKGTSVVELHWRHNDDGWVPQSTAWVHPGHYAWGSDGRLGLLVKSQNGSRGATSPTSFFSSNIFTNSRGVETVDFPEHKFLIAINRAKSGHPSQGALLRPLAWWWCAANFSAEWLLNFGQIFGLPIRWATYDPTQPGLLDKICDMLENMGSTAWGAFPTGTQFELKEASKSGGGSDTPQGNMLDRADKQCDLLVLGQTLTSDVGDKGAGSRALGTVHEGVLEDIVQAAADFAAQVINQQLVPAILQLNWGDDAEAPEFCPEPRKIEDAKANAERDKILSEMGMQFPTAFMHERHNVPMPQKGEPVLKPLSSADGGATRAGHDEDEKAAMKARNSHGSSGDAPSHFHNDEVTDQLIESVSGVEARWLGGLRPYYRDLILLAQNAASDAEFEAALRAVIQRSEQTFPDVFARVDVQFLADRLEGLLGASCVNGAVRGYLKRGTGFKRQERKEREGDFIINASPAARAERRALPDNGGGR
jgi:phage gp29-like protein